MLYRRGWPTSVVLLLLMIVAKISLSLSRHPPLGLHHLLRLVRAPRRLVALRGIEVLKISARVGTSMIGERGHGVRLRATMPRGSSTIYTPC